MDSELRDMYAEEELAFALGAAEGRLKIAVALLHNLVAMSAPHKLGCTCAECIARLWLKGIGEERE